MVQPEVAFLCNGRVLQRNATSGVAGRRDTDPERITHIVCG